MMQNRYILALVVSALIWVPSRAQSSSAVLPFLSMDRNPVNAALAGAGLSATFGADESYATFGNVAAASFMEKHFALGVSYGMWAPSVQKEHIVGAGGAFKVAPWCALTVGFARDMYSEIDLGGGKSYKPADLVLGGGIAFSVASCFGFGVNVKYAQQHLLEEYRLFGVSMDAYAQYHGKDFNVMAGVTNFGPKVRSSVVNTQYSLIPSARVAADYVAHLGIVHLQPALSGEFAFDRHWALAAGMQVGVKEIGWLRLGYRYASAGSVIPSHLALGAGATFYGVRLSATFLTANKELGNSFLIGVGYSF